MLFVMSALTFEDLVALPTSTSTRGRSFAMLAASSLPAFQSVRSTHLCVAELWGGLSEVIAKEPFLFFRAVLHANQYCAFSTQAPEHAEYTANPAPSILSCF